MSRPVLALIIALFLPVSAFGLNNDGPPIAIKSPDIASTYPHADIKKHTLIWQKKTKTLVACVTFVDSRSTDNSTTDDTHLFQIPGITFDEAKGIFTATAANGEVIPVASIKKAVFLQSIEVTPNANVRIQCISGDATVILEAISPSDPSMHHSKYANTDPEATQKLDFHHLLK